MRSYSNFTVLEVVQKLKTNLKSGLSLEEVGNRQEKHGYNELPHLAKTTKFKILFSQFKTQLKNILIYIPTYVLILHRDAGLTSLINVLPHA